jgi:hypothetical protein
VLESPVEVPSFWYNLAEFDSKNHYEKSPPNRRPTLHRSGSKNLHIKKLYRTLRQSYTELATYFSNANGWKKILPEVDWAHVELNQLRRAYKQGNVTFDCKETAAFMKRFDEVSKGVKPIIAEIRCFLLKVDDAAEIALKARLDEPIWDLDQEDLQIEHGVTRAVHRVLEFVDDLEEIIDVGESLKRNGFG